MKGFKYGGVFLGRLSVGAADGCDGGNAKCQREIKSAYFKGVLRWVMSYE
jgi:hypothetical protein